MGILRTTFLISAIAVTGGCYRWVPTEQATIPPGAEVRANLTDAGVEEMRRYFGPDITSVEGPLVSWDGRGLSVLSETTLRRAGFPPTVLTDTIQLQPTHLADVAIRELDGKRTALFTVATLGAAAGAVMAALIFGGTAEEPGESGGPPPEASVILRIPFSLGIR